MTTPHPSFASPLPPDLLHELHDPDSKPPEMRIIKHLVFRIFAQSETNNHNEPHSYIPGCCIYQISDHLVTQCEHYYPQNRLNVKYRIGVTERFTNISEEVVSQFVTSNQKSQFLYDHIIGKHSSSFHSMPFCDYSDTKPANPDKESLRIIRENVPQVFEAYLTHLLAIKPISVRAVRFRKTKCGDHRRLSCGKHIITVNETKHPLSFTLTLLHELAHAFAPRTTNATPHDKHWKLIFANMLVDCLDLFPPNLKAYITLQACNPQHSKDICEEYVLTNCASDDFKEHSIERIRFLRTRIELEQRFGIKFGDVLQPPTIQGGLGIHETKPTA